MLKPAHAKALMQEAAGRKGDIPTKAEILKRSDEKPPTLIPSENSMVLGERVFAMGNSRDQGTSKNSPRSSSVAPRASTGAWWLTWPRSSSSLLLRSSAMLKPSLSSHTRTRWSKWPWISGLQWSVSEIYIVILTFYLQRVLFLVQDEL